MAWEYKQSTGEMTHDGQTFATGYSGHGDGVNNPADEAIPNIGPVPVGVYTIGEAFTHPHAGPICMRLTPAAGDEEFGRAGFMIHGDNAAANHTASEGCIILPHDARIALSEAVAAGDNQLTVIA